MRRPKKEQTYETFIFEIVDWQPDYHFSINQSKYEDGLYWEHASVKIVGRCLLPGRFLDRSVNLWVMGERNIHTPSILQYQKDWKPLGVGTIWLRGSRSEFYGSVPYGALWGLATMMAAGKCKFAVLHGPTLKRGKSATQSLSFEREINLDDY